MHHVSWYGPIYHEYARLEERSNRLAVAIYLVELGLQNVPRYGPLWITALRLYERFGQQGQKKARELSNRALTHLSNELIWKFYFEVAQMEERCGSFTASAAAYASSVSHCPPNLRWKIWLSGARMELLRNDPSRYEVARMLLQRAAVEVPKKMKAMVLLECSRFEEFCGNIDGARTILLSAQSETKHEWKVFLELILLELRSNNLSGAITAAETALQVHSGTGRLWAILIQLRQGNESEQLKIFRAAIREVPKSGEVWCEGARIALNPASSHFNLKLAKRFLNFAVQFTPQYGDSFVEYLRLKMLCHGSSKEIDVDGVEHEPAHLLKVKQMAINAEPNYGCSWLAHKQHTHATAVEILDVAAAAISAELYQHRTLYAEAMTRGFYSGDNDKTVDETASEADQLCQPHKQTEDNINPTLINNWISNNLNSLLALYPAIKSVAGEEKHKVLFSADPIVP